MLETNVSSTILTGNNQKSSAIANYICLPLHVDPFDFGCYHLLRGHAGFPENPMKSHKC